MSRRCLPILLAFAASVAARAESAPSPEANLFGDDIVRKLDQGSLVADETPAKPAGGSQILFFHDGRRLHGEIVALTKDEIEWRRSGVSEPLRIAREEVQSIVLAEPEETPEGGPQIPDSEPPENADTPTPAISAAATLKLGGSDWLFGDVTSADGQNFTCRLHGGPQFTLPRGQIEWLYGDNRPAPVCELSANALNLNGWRSNSGTARLETKDGALTLRDAVWLQRTARLPARFEVILEMPADTEDGTRLWLQPDALQPETYSTGTITLGLNAKQLERDIFSDGFTRKMVKVAQNSGSGTVTYRVFYDGRAARLAVLRNGETLGDWNITEELKNRRRAPTAAQAINSVCLDRDEQTKKVEIRFSRVEVRPWSGLLPKNGEPELEGDVLSLGEAPPRPGKLESLAEKTFMFSGTKLDREAGAFVRFPQHPAALGDATSVLDFGAQGQLGAADLEIQHGKARCRTVFTSVFTTPVSTLKTIAFSAHADAAPRGDTLVFKNGDELSGTLLAAANDGPLRWKTARGREVKIEPAQTAGVRFAIDRKARDAENDATVELRNGDRLHGAFIGLNERQLQFQQTQLGALAIDRSQAWRLYPNPRFAAHDGACDVDAWLAAGNPREIFAPGNDEDESATKIPWLYLDGRYVMCPHRGTNSDSAASLLQSTAGGALERFEVRFDITHAGESQPVFTLQFADKSNESLAQILFSDGELRLFAANPNAKNGVNQREVAVNEQLPDPSTRVNVRAFVNRKTGLIDFLIDGVPVAKFGRVAEERMPGIGAHVVLQAQSEDENATVVSNLWIGPWSGELPKSGDDERGAIALANGDVASGTPAAWHEGTFSFESDIGPLELPAAKVQSVEFGGVLATEPAAARVRLPDGSALNLDHFRWKNGGMTGHSATLGDIRLTADAIGELIFAPPVEHGPRIPPPKRIAQKAEEKPAE